MFKNQRNKTSKSFRFIVAKKLGDINFSGLQFDAKNDFLGSPLLLIKIINILETSIFCEGWKGLSRIER